MPRPRAASTRWCGPIPEPDEDRHERGPDSAEFRNWVVQRYGPQDDHEKYRAEYERALWAEERNIDDVRAFRQTDSISEGPDRGRREAGLC